MVEARIPELKDCGFGIPLSVGAKIIAIVFCIMNSIGIIASLYFIIKFEIELRIPNQPFIEYRNETWKEVMSSLVLIICSIKGTLAYCLWYGVKEHKPSFVLPWAILTAAFTFIFTFIEVLLMLHKLTIEVVLLGVVLMVMYYCILIVYSHFRELRREKNLPQTLNEAEAA